MKVHEPDEKNRQLRVLLQQDARQSLEALAGKVALSAPAVQRRIRRMREAGIITGELAVVEPATVGLPMTFIVIVELERKRAEASTEQQPREAASIGT